MKVYQLSKYQQPETSMSEPATKDKDSKPAIPPTPKHIVCCFDGTGNKFGENSNVVRFLDTLVKDQPDKQVIYYQPGIGTYSEHQYYTATISQLFSRLDECLALFLDNHVKEGYKFIMQHYKPGDKICLFGFSRGAYIARVIMGMLYKVGLLPPDNIQQVDFAFSVYKMTGDKGRELSREFKKTFAFPITVEFVGVWDTVASVGITPTPTSRHPYTSVDYATKFFRHALALDERRVRFQPQTWNAGTADREQELDVDEPDFPEPGQGSDIYDYIPPKRDVADVKEVWFAGCHADIGGGSHHGRFQHSLSYIPFRWMIREVQKTKCGILFDKNHLESNYVFDSRKRPDYVSIHKPAAEKDTDTGKVKLRRRMVGISPERFGDMTAPTYDQLSDVKAWWALELLPLLTTYQTMNGKWVTERRRNLGDGRRIPFHSDRKEVLVHCSVRWRLDLDEEYKPAALNWTLLNDANMIRWVDENDAHVTWTVGFDSLEEAKVRAKETAKEIKEEKEREKARKKYEEELEADEDSYEDEDEDYDEDDEDYDEDDEEDDEEDQEDGDEDEEEPEEPGAAGDKKEEVEVL